MKKRQGLMERLLQKLTNADIVDDLVRECDRVKAERATALFERDQALQAAREAVERHEQERREVADYRAQVDEFHRWLQQHELWRHLLADWQAQRVHEKRQQQETGA